MEKLEKELFLESIKNGDDVNLVMIDGKQYSGKILNINTDKIILQTIDGRTIMQKIDSIDTFEQIISSDDNDGKLHTEEEPVFKKENESGSNDQKPDTKEDLTKAHMTSGPGTNNNNEDNNDKSEGSCMFPPDSHRISRLIKDKYGNLGLYSGFIHDDETGKDLYFEVKDILDEDLINIIIKRSNNLSLKKNIYINLNYFKIKNPLREGQLKAICIHRMSIENFIAKLEITDENDQLLFDYIKKKIEWLKEKRRFQEALIIVDRIFDYFEEKDLETKLKNYLKKVRYIILKKSGDKEKFIMAYSDYVEDCMLLTDMGDFQKGNLLRDLAKYLEDNLGERKKILSYLYRAQKLNPNDSIAKQMINRIRTLQDPVFHDVRDLILSTSESYDFTDLINFDIKTPCNDSRQSGSKTTIDTLLNDAHQKQFVSSEESYENYLKVLYIYNRKGLIEGNEEEYKKIQAEYAVQKAYDSLNFIVRGKESEMRTYFDVGRSYMMVALSMGIDNQETLNKLFTEYIRALFVISKQDYSIDYEWNQLVIEYAFGNEDIKKRLIWSFLIDVGSTNERIWNSILDTNNGIAEIHKLFQKGKIENTYRLINEVEGEDRNVKLPARRFLHETFQTRRERTRQVCDQISKLEMTNLNDRQKLVDYLDIILKESDYILSKSNKEQVLQRMLEIINYLENYGSLTTTDHINMLENSINETKKIINYLENPESSTYIGKVTILPIALNWKRIFEESLRENQRELLPRLSVVLNPEYLTPMGDFDRCFTLQVTNKGERSANRYKIKYTIVDEDQNIEPESREIDSLGPLLAREGNLSTYQEHLPTSMMHSHVINLNIEVQAFCDDIATNVVCYRFTVTDSPNINNIINDETVILWDYGRPAIPEYDRRITEHHLFFGRNELVKKLVNHYLSDRRDHTYVLYGLSRTGKTSILNKLKREMLNKEIQKDEKTMKMAPLPISLDIDLNNDSSFIWRSIIEKQICEEYKKQVNKFSYPILHYHKDSYSSYDLNDIVEEFNKIGVFPFIFIDEFSFISNMLKRGDIGGPFVHMLRQLALDEKACFIFAGTYDIKDLMNNPHSEMLSTGDFSNINEMEIAEISREDAELLMDAMKDRLQFTKEAKEHIHYLSGDIPYFIQIICYSCAEFAKNRYDWIGIPELNHVVNILVGNEEPVNECALIPPARFDSNMLDKNHPLEQDVLKYISLYKAMEETTSPMPLAEIQTRWNKEIPSRTPEELSATIQRLLDKRIIKSIGNKGYIIKVDLFRLWYKVYCLKTSTID